MNLTWIYFFPMVKGTHESKVSIVQESHNAALNLDDLLLSGFLTSFKILL